MADVAWMSYPIDTDAATYLTAAGITDVTMTNATDYLFKNLKANGLYTKMQAMYLFLNGTAASCKWNAVNPLDTDAAFRLTFTGSPTFSSNGVDWDGASQYADTHLNPSVNMTANNCHISYYSRESDSGSIYDMGAQTSANTAQRLLMEIQFGGQLTVNIYDPATSGIGVTNTDGKNFYVATRTASNAVAAYKQGFVLSTNGGAAGTQANANIFIGACSNGALVLNYGKLQCAFASIGTSMTAEEVLIFSQIIQTFQIILGRNV